MRIVSDSSQLVVGHSRLLAIVNNLNFMENVIWTLWGGGGGDTPFDFSDPIDPSFITTMRISVFSIRNVLFYPRGDTPLRLLRPYPSIVHHDYAYFGVFYKKCFVLPWGATPPFDFSHPIGPSFITTMRISVFSIRDVLFYPGGRHPPSTSQTLSTHRSSRLCVFRCFL